MMRLFFLLIIPLLYYYKREFDSCLARYSKNPKALMTLFVIVIFALTLRIGHTTYRLSKSSYNMEDIAHVHLRAIPLLFVQHKNPYSEPIDHYPVESSKGTVDYAALKYPPLGMFYYAPFVALFGDKGIYVGNALLYFFVAFLIYQGLLVFSRFHAYLGLLFFLASDFYFRLAMNRGTNDFLPTICMLLGMIALKQNKSTASGFMFGLSLLAKQFPVGVVLMICLFQKHWRVVLVSGLVFCVGVFPFLIWDHKGFIENVVIFNLVRPVRGSSILQNFSQPLQIVIPLVGIILVGLLAFLGNWQKLFRITQGWFFLVVAFLIFLLTSKMTPYHYFVWVLPFLILYFISPSQDSEENPTKNVC